LLDREGIEAFSVRGLAENLGVTPMAIYNHVDSKQDLLTAIAETVVEQVEYPSIQGDWRKVIRVCFQALRRACLAHPGAVPLVESAQKLPASIFRPMEITLTVLRKAGLRPEDALRAYFLLTTFTLGQLSYQIRGWSQGVDPGAAVRNNRISRVDFPEVFQAISRAEQWNFDKSFEFGLSVIIAGLSLKVMKADRPNKSRFPRAP
jgi:AcrR family transcriptional regulator